MTTPTHARAVCAKLLSRRGVPSTEHPILNVAGPAVALDIEGVNLGRFGRICLVQLSTRDRQFFLIDALKPGIIKELKPLLEDQRVAKVMHDCREDSAALHHQHGVKLRTVFDAQTVHAVLEHRAGRSRHLCSAAYLESLYCSVPMAAEQGKVKAWMRRDGRLWSRRPMKGALVKYALSGVSHLLELRRKLLAEVLDKYENEPAVSEELVRACDRGLQYRYLNGEFESAAAMAKPGTKLWGLVTARTDVGVFFKLNAGRVGLASTPGAIARFGNLQIGDMILCCVSGVNIDGGYIYLDKYDNDWDYFTHQERPAPEPEVGSYGREHKHESSLFLDSEHDVDPLLVRGLPSAEGLEGSQHMDPWEAGPEDIGFPEEVENQRASLF